MTGTKIKWAIGAAGVAVIIGLALRHLLIVGKPVTFFDYFVLDIAFMPLQVIVVSVIIERLLHEREKRAMLKKLNMVIGAFFSDVGNELLRRLAPLCEELRAIEKDISPGPRWDDHDFDAAVSAVLALKGVLRLDPAGLDDLRRFLPAHRGFILGLLQNPNLLEHETFTDLLWAVTHLAEELAARGDLASLPASDFAHLGGDANRAFKLLVREWLDYMRHLHAHYPYIYSLAMRTSPVASHTSVVIEG